MAASPQGATEDGCLRENKKGIPYRAWRMGLILFLCGSEAKPRLRVGFAARETANPLADSQPIPSLGPQFSELVPFPFGKVRVFEFDRFASQFSPYAFQLRRRQRFAA